MAFSGNNNYSSSYDRYDDRALGFGSGRHHHHHHPGGYDSYNTGYGSGYGSGYNSGYGNNNNNNSWDNAPRSQYQQDIDRMRGQVRAAEDFGADDRQPGRLSGVWDKGVGAVQSGLGRVTGNPEMMRRGMERQGHGEYEVNRAAEMARIRNAEGYGNDSAYGTAGYTGLSYPSRFDSNYSRPTGYGSSGYGSSSYGAGYGSGYGSSGYGSGYGRREGVMGRLNDDLHGDRNHDGINDRTGRLTNDSASRNYGGFGSGYGNTGYGSSGYGSGYGRREGVLGRANDDLHGDRNHDGYNDYTGRRTNDSASRDNGNDDSRPGFFARIKDRLLGDSDHDGYNDRTGRPTGGNRGGYDSDYDNQRYGGGGYGSGYNSAPGYGLSGRSGYNGTSSAYQGRVL
ncbi:hypothetical protein RI367_006222 [Sorochytrium milnesiophthora]